ncbi:MAG: hypothetical protein LBG51_02375 [Bacteroidales bacterium OttesenSCG-928-I14]|jgi:hypothetical protein|nr:hypothetical protein [Bacteroidales bacterium OttesenSCG-928-I14]
MEGRNHLKLFDFGDPVSVGGGHTNCEMYEISILLGILNLGNFSQWMMEHCEKGGGILSRVIRIFKWQYPTMIE